VRCVTLREETEWVDTVEAGWNTIVGIDADAFERALATPLPKERPAIFGDGLAARRIARIVVDFIATSKRAAIDTELGGAIAETSNQNIEVVA